MLSLCVNNPVHDSEMFERMKHKRDGERKSIADNTMVNKY